MDECYEDIYKRCVFLEWCNKDLAKTIFTKAQRAADWPPTVYAKCSFFLDYPHGKYLDDEAEDFSEVTKKFKQKVLHTVKYFFTYICTHYV